MKNTISLILLTLITACGEKPAPEPIQKLATFEEIVAKSSCMACHRAGSEMKFPTWGEVAEKYKNDKNASSFLINKIAKGGSGSWGKMDMPPYPELSEAERAVIVRGILASPVDIPE
jgi:cytochrome c